MVSNRLFLITIILSGLILAPIVIGSNLPEQLSKVLTPQSKVSKLQVCPESWYKNEMPCVYRESPSECEQQRKEYFIVNGERKEIEEVDISWVKENCEVNKPEVIY